MPSPAQRLPQNRKQAAQSPRFPELRRKAALTPCFWMATLVRWTNMLSSSLVLRVYLTVQKRQKPSLYLRAGQRLGPFDAQRSMNNNTLCSKELWAGLFQTFKSAASFF